MHRPFISIFIIVKRLTFVFLILFSEFMHAQDSEQGIRGNITDSYTGKYLESANLILVGTGHGTISKSDGSFEISGILSGKYELQVSMIGYKLMSQIVVIRENAFTNISITLEPEIVSIDTVTIVGTKKRNYLVTPALEPRSLETAISSVNSKEIERQGAITVIDAMKYIPGSVIENRGRKVKQFFSVRGQTYPYPDYAINGIWQREFHETPYFFSAGDIQEVEIIRSGSALLTGLSGLSGIVNIKTREYQQTETSADVKYGTFNTMHLHLSHGGKHKNFSYAAGAGYDRTDGPENKNAAEKIGTLYGRLVWQPVSCLSVHTSLYYLNGSRELALADKPAGSRLREEISSYNPFRCTMASMKIRYQPGEKASTEMDIFYTGRKPVYRWTDIKTSEIFQADERDHEWGINILQVLQIKKDNHLRFGGLYNHWIAPEGKRFYNGKRCDLETISGVIVDEQTIGRFTLDGGLRWTKTYINDFGGFGTEGSGSLFTDVTAITDEWQPAGLQAAAGVTWNLSKTFSLVCHSAMGQIRPRKGSLDDHLTEPGNETRTKADLGWETWWNSKAKMTLTGFIVDQKDAIMLSGQTYEVNDQIMELYKNQDQYHIGLEFEMRTVQVTDHFDAFINFTVMRSRAEEDGVMKTSSEFPAILTNGGIFMKWSGFDANLFAKYTGKFESSRFVPQAPGEPTVFAPLGDFFTLDLTLGYTIGSHHTARLYLEIIDLTGKQYTTVPGYFDFGRRINAGIHVTI